MAGGEQQPTVETSASVKCESEKVEDDVGGDDASRADTAAESDVKEDALQAESDSTKPPTANHDNKTEPGEEIEVEVEEFYVKYKNL